MSIYALIFVERRTNGRALVEEGTERGRKPVLITMQFVGRRRSSLCLASTRLQRGARRWQRMVLKLDRAHLTMSFSPPTCLTASQSWSVVDLGLRNCQPESGWEAAVLARPRQSL